MKRMLIILVILLFIQVFSGVAVHAGHVCKSQVQLKKPDAAAATPFIPLPAVGFFGTL